MHLVSKIGRSRSGEFFYHEEVTYVVRSVGLKSSSCGEVKLNTSNQILGSLAAEEHGVLFATKICKVNKHGLVKMRSEIEKLQRRRIYTKAFQGCL